MKSRFIEIPASAIIEIRHSGEGKEVLTSGMSLVSTDHIVYARKDSTGDWVLRLTTGVEFVLHADSEKFLRGFLMS